MHKKEDGVSKQEKSFVKKEIAKKMGAKSDTRKRYENYIAFSEKEGRPHFDLKGKFNKGK